MLRPDLASESNFDDFYELKCDPHNIFWTGHASAPKREDLRSWYARNMQNAGRRIVLFYDDDSVIGYLYIDLMRDREYEISYGVLNGFAGRGFGTEIVRAAEKLISESWKPASCIHAWIAETNAGSIKCVQRNGFNRTDDTDSRKLGGEDVVFRRYIKLAAQDAD